jgi:UDP-N-acetylmuramoylalanine--D-glutamate ligase
VRFSAQSFFDAMAGQKIDIIGLGLSHTELVFRLCEAKARVTVRDRREIDRFEPQLIKKLGDAGAQLQFGEHYLERLEGGIIFRTPGMNFLHPALVKARGEGRVVTGELEVFMSVCPCPVYAVTGSDGKTTTASLTAAMLARKYKNVHLGGNIGRAMLHRADKISSGDVCVLELSSFQLISMRCSPDVAVVTNLRPNHLDIHRDMDEYMGAKKNIVLHQDAFSKTVLSADCKNTSGLSPLVRGKTVWFSGRGPVENGAFLRGDGALVFAENKKETHIIDRRDVLLPGFHNVENLLAACAAVGGDVGAKDMAHVAAHFAGVEHRIERVREKDGVLWYNDSIATSPSRTAAALGSFEQKLIVIAGGYDKQLSFEPMVHPLLTGCKKLILTGATALAIERAVRQNPNFEGSGLEILQAASLDEAVALADGIARAGDIVILSPACASFDSFENFEKRGEYFKKLVNSL